MNNLDLQSILLYLPGIVIGLSVHEFAHAFAAYKLGDDTAKSDGRLTLNPLKHIDPIGFIFMLIAGFGWAKPVQFNPQNLKNKHKDEIIISLAGPFSNLIMGVLFLVLTRGLYALDYFGTTDQGISILNFFIICASLNFGLFVFNLIPLPPLDGSHLYLTFLQEIKPMLMAQIYRYGSFALLIIIVLENRTGIDILPIGKVISFLMEFMINILQFN